MLLFKQISDPGVQRPLSFLSCRWANLLFLSCISFTWAHSFAVCTLEEVSACGLCLFFSFSFLDAMQQGISGELCGKSSMLNKFYSSSEFSASQRTFSFDISTWLGSSAQSAPSFGSLLLTTQPSRLNVPQGETAGITVAQHEAWHLACGEGQHQAVGLLELCSAQPSWGPHHTPAVFKAEWTNLSTPTSSGALVLRRGLRGSPMPGIQSMDSPQHHCIFWYVLVSFLLYKHIKGLRESYPATLELKLPHD